MLVIDLAVLSIGGSTINPGTIDPEYIKKLGRLLADYHVGVVVGGGSSARQYAKAMRDISENEFLADECAILSTKQNALLLMAAMGKSAYPEVTNDFSKARGYYYSGKSVVMYGTIPGITTDTDSVLLAEALGIKKLINISNIDGIYDKNPAIFPDAKKLKELTHDELIVLSSREDERKAGTNFVFDSVAAKLAKRSMIEIHFVSSDLKEIEKALKGSKHSGTVVR